MHSMKCVETIHAVGHVLCHDLTRIVPGEMKDAQFRKGHIVTEEDIPVLLSMGKDRLFVWERDEHTLHEDEAAERLADLCQGAHMTRSKPKEGKIELRADCDGLFLVDVKRLDLLNDTDEVMVATRHTNTGVRAGDKLAGTRIIPLIIDERKIELLEQRVGKEPLLQLVPYRKGLRAGIVTTGNEVFQRHRGCRCQLIYKNGKEIKDAWWKTTLQSAAKIKRLSGASLVMEQMNIQSVHVVYCDIFFFAASTDGAKRGLLIFDPFRKDHQINTISGEILFPENRTGGFCRRFSLAAKQNAMAELRNG